MSGMNIDNRTESEKKKEFDTYIFRLLELIENMSQITDGEYKESCDIFMELRKLFQETRIQIINNPIFETMVRRATRSVGDYKYMSELEKVYDDKYEKCERCSSMIKNGRSRKNGMTNMEQHQKRKKCVMNHEAKFQSIKIGEIKDGRIANRMIYASTFTFNLKQAHKIKDLNKDKFTIFPHLEYTEEEMENMTEEEYNTKITQVKSHELWVQFLECNKLYANNQEEIDWYKDRNGNWRENGKI
jgi:hypothetical protein